MILSYKILWFCLVKSFTVDEKMLKFCLFTIFYFSYQHTREWRHIHQIPHHISFQWSVKVYRSRHARWRRNITAKRRTEACQIDFERIERRKRKTEKWLQWKKQNTKVPGKKNCTFKVPFLNKGLNFQSLIL